MLGYHFQVCRPGTNLTMVTFPVNPPLNPAEKLRVQPGNPEKLRFASKRCHRLIAAGVIALALTGCNGTEAPTGQLDSGMIELGIPEKIRQVSAVNLDAVTAIANVNSVDYPMTRNGDRFQTTITLDNVASLAVNLRFAETLESGYVLNLARHSQVTRNVDSNNITMEFFESGFDTNFDDDGDSVSNLQERELGTDPTFTDNATRSLTLNFAVPSIVPAPEVIQPFVLFSGTPRVSRPENNGFTVTGTIGSGTVPVEVRLIQRINVGTETRPLELAVANQTIASGFDSVTLELFDNDFDFNRDIDGDGVTNVEEVRNGTDPFTAN